MTALYRKEMKSYFGGMFGFFIMAVLLLFTGLFIAVFNLVAGNADFSYPLNSMKLVLTLLIPLLAMRSLAEERHSRTDQLLYSLPLRLSEVVLAKFFAAFTVFLIPTLLTGLYPLLLSCFGKLSFAAAYTALLGYILLGASLIAVCLFVSSLVENQIVAVLLSVAAMLLFYLMNGVTPLIPTGALVSFLLCILAALTVAAILWATSKNFGLGIVAAAVLILPTCLVYFLKPEWFISLVPDFLVSIDVFNRMYGFTYGHLDLPGIVFYLTFTAFFLFLTLQSMEKRRWC